MEGAGADRASNASGSSLLHFKRSFMPTASPRSPLSHDSLETSSIDLALLDDSGVDNLIEQLYDNVYDMASSDQSSSSCSFASHDNESSIDAELRHLVGVEKDDDGLDHDKKSEKKITTMNKRKMGLDAIKGQPGKMSSSLRRVQSQGVRREENPALERSISTNDKPPTARRASAPNKELRSKQAVNSNRRNGRDDIAMKFLVAKGPGVKGLRKSSTFSSGEILEKSSVARSSSLKGLRRSVLVYPPSKERSSGFEETDSRDVGLRLLNKARDVISSGGNPIKALELALEAKKCFETLTDQNEPDLDYVLCLHILASMHCSSGQYEEAIAVLEKSIEIIPQAVEDETYVLAKSSGCMHLGDVYGALGQIKSSMHFYGTALKIQREAFGDSDARFGDACGYVAEAYVQAFRLDEAEKLCQIALDIHSKSSSPHSMVTADLRLMGLISESKGSYKAALEHYHSARLTMLSSECPQMDIAAIDCNIGDVYLALSRYDEALVSYHKALYVFKSCKGLNYLSVASVFVRLAELHRKLGRFDESKSYCEVALKAYNNPPPGTPSEEISNGLVDLAATYESLDELELALDLLQKALKTLKGKQTTSAGIEAQIGVLHYVLGRYRDSYEALKSAVPKLQSCGEKSSLGGIALNQMGLASLRLGAIGEAAELFEEAREVLDKAFGPTHPNTLGACSNLAAAYDALGRLFDAIKVLEYVMGKRVGTADAAAIEEKKRLEDMLKQAEKARSPFHTSYSNRQRTANLSNGQEQDDPAQITLFKDRTRVYL